MSRPTMIDAFSGAGLFSAGMKSAGFDPILAIELSKDAATSYARNVGGHVVHGAVEDITVAPRADVVVAGPPCQGFSTLGRRDPLDVRNGLCLSILPIVATARPTLVVVENVVPFLASPQWQRLARSLRGRGYTVETWELEAHEFGTPQMRRRAFTVASKIGRIGPPHPTRRRPMAGDVLSTAERPIDRSDPMHYWPVPSGPGAVRIPLIPANGDRRDLVLHAPELCPPSWFKLGAQATDVWGRMDPNAPANTLRCAFQNPSKGRYLHPTENRVISLREGARLQGVPDSWTFAGEPLPIARQIGNGVPIPLAAAVGRRLIAALSSSKEIAA